MAKERTPYGDFDRLLRDVREMVEDVVAGLPPGAATLTVEDNVGPEGAPPVLFVITPRQEWAARINVLPDSDDTVYLALGQHTWVEIFVSGKNWPELVPSARETLEQVVSGKFREIIWTRDGQFVNSLGYVQSKDGKWHLIGEISRPLFRWGLEREEVHYRPYS
jgi:hypothetical protein